MIKFEALKSPITAHSNQLQFCLGIRATTLHISPKHQNSNLAEIQSPSTKAENKTDLPKNREKEKKALFPVPTPIHMVSHIKVDSVQEVEEKFMLFLLSYCALFVLRYLLFSFFFFTVSFIIYILSLCICAFSLSLWKSLEVEQLVQISTKLDLLRKRRVSKAANCCQYVECSCTMQTSLLRKHENIAKGTTDPRVECFCQSKCLKSYNKV